MSKLNRRDVLKVGAASAALGVLAGCQNPRRWVYLEPFVRPPEEQLAGMPTWYATTCRQCPSGCGVLVKIMNGRAVKLEGNPEHPLNQGKLCARGQAGLQVLYNPDRLNTPAKQAQRGSRNLSAITYEEALNTLLEKIKSAGDQIAFWGGSTSSSHLVELFQKFSTAVGAPPPVFYDLYTAFNGYTGLLETGQNLFNQHQLPNYDLGQADVIFSFGADFVGTWLSTTRYGLEFGKFRNQALGKRGYLVQFEPRMSATGAKADRWLPARPGSEALLAQGLARLMVDQASGPADRLERARSLAADVDLQAVTNAAEISISDLQDLARIFMNAERPVAIPGQNLTGQSQSLQAITAVQSLNLIAGVVGQPGGLIPGQGLTQSDLVETPTSTYAQVQELIGRMNAGQVQVLLVHGANPIYDLPPQSGLVEAMKKVPFIVNFAPLLDETGVWSDLLLPDRTYLESWGYSVASPNFGLPHVSSQQPVVEPVYDLHSAADLLLTVARGLPAVASVLPWADEVAFVKERVSQYLAGMNAQGGVDEQIARFQQHGGWWPASPPKNVVVSALPPKATPLNSPKFQGDEQTYPYFLHIFMTSLMGDGSGAHLPWLQGSPDINTTIAWQTWVEINPLTAQKLKIQEGDLLTITSPYGELQAPAYLYPAVRPDTVAIPLGQGHTEYGRYARQRGSNPMALVGPQADSQNGNLYWANLRVKITPTGKHVDLATFENAVGVGSGFLNKAYPGQ